LNNTVSNTAQNKPPIRIVLADDHAILRSGLKLLLNNQAGFEVVGEAQNGSEALRLAEQLQPDVLLLDLSMPEVDGLTVLQNIKSVAPNTRVLVLTMHDDSTHLQQTIQSGASGYLLKKAVDTELLMAIQAVLRGELYVHSAMTQHLFKPAGVEQPAANSDPWKVLSEREFDILKRVALGYTNAEIAAELYLSPKTVETYRARGMEKLELQTRAQLVKSAMQNGHLE
jgi:two-component system, NarL family, response regulator NreC